MNRRSFLRALVSGIAAVGLAYGGGPAVLSGVNRDRLLRGLWVSPEEMAKASPSMDGPRYRTPTYRGVPLRYESSFDVFVPRESSHADL